MSRYYRHNPDQPISHDWISTDRFHPERGAGQSQDEIEERLEREEIKGEMARDLQAEREAWEAESIERD